MRQLEWPRTFQENWRTFDGRVGGRNTGLGVG